jgi:hypothetical protein
MPYILTIMVVRDENNKSRDDVIRFSSSSARPDMVDVSTSFEGKKHEYNTTMTRDRCPHYVRTLIRSLVKDDDPFESIQVNSSLFPSVLYKLEDLEDDTLTQTTLHDLVCVSFGTHVTSK